jgi:hypothetical protein
VTILGDGGGQDVWDVGLNSTNILSVGPISITGQGTGWAGGLFTGQVDNATNSSSSTLGYCAASTCTGSRVTNSSAAISITANRFTSFNPDVSLTVNTAGAFSFVPSDAAGFSEFKVSGQGLSFSTDCTGVTIGKDQSTNVVTNDNRNIKPNIRISGPINIYGNYINVYGILETSAGSSGNINIKTVGRTYLENATLRALGSGSISIAAGTVGDHAIQSTGATVSATSGSVTLTGQSSNASASAVYMYGGTVVQTTSGPISISGTAVSGTWGLFFAAANILSSSGPISLNGGVQGVVTGYGATTNIGATAAASSSSQITLTADRYWDGSTATNIKSTGSVVIESAANQFSGAVTLQNHTFSSHTSLRIGKATNNRDLTLNGTGSVNISGNYTPYGANITQTTSATSSTGSISINPSGTYSGAGNLSATAGSVSISAGSTVSPTGVIQAGGGVSLSGTTVTTSASVTASGSNAPGDCIAS